MNNPREPRLRHVRKFKPPFSLNEFPKEFPFKLGKELIYIAATKEWPSIEGSEWEQVFARCIGAQWKPSNVGLDDIILDNCAWSAKSVKNNHPDKAKRIRLISGRNSPDYSFGSGNPRDVNPAKLGKMIISIWNSRVSEIRQKYEDLRTIVLMKSPSFDCFSVFEYETIRYESEYYKWSWNKSPNPNLIGCDEEDNTCFTWQPHGSQFTIHENIPDDILIIKIKKPPIPDIDNVMKRIGFDNSWITVEKRNGR